MICGVWFSRLFQKFRPEKYIIFPELKAEKYIIFPEMNFVALILETDTLTAKKFGR